MSRWDWVRFPHCFVFPIGGYHNCNKTTEIESERISFKGGMPRPTPLIYIYTFCGHFESDTWFFKRFVEMRLKERGGFNVFDTALQANEKSE